MGRRGVRLTVLCEDAQHERFTHHVFLQLGYHYREIRVLHSLVARGAAEQWVREHYAVEVRVHRRQASHQKVALLVVIDADKGTVLERHRQLEKRLKDEGLAPRSPDELVVIWVPRRNIYTWVAWVLHHEVNEDGDFETLVRGEGYRLPAVCFVGIYKDRDNRPDNLLPSISSAFDELDRLPG